MNTETFTLYQRFEWNAIFANFYLQGDNGVFVVAIYINFNNDNRFEQNFCSHHGLIDFDSGSGSFGK